MSWRVKPHCLDLYNAYSDLSYKLISQDLYLRFLNVLHRSSKLAFSVLKLKMNTF